MFARTLSRSIPELIDTNSISHEERNRLQEKQKLLNMSFDNYGSYSPLTLSSNIPSRYNNTDLSIIYDDPWGIQRHQVKQEQQYTSQQQQPQPHEIYMMKDEMPISNPFLMKTNSIPINPFHTEVAPSAMLFPYEQQQQTSMYEQQQQQPSQTSLFDDMISPQTSLMSDDSDDEQQPPHETTYKRQRGMDNNIIYIKQEQTEDQDLLSLPVLENDGYEQQPPQQQPMLCSEPSQFVDYTSQTTTNIYPTLQQETPFTLETTTPFTLTPLSLATMNNTPTTTTTTSSRRSSIDSMDSHDSLKQQRKRKSSISSTSTKQRKSTLIGTHAIENTGAPVKMAKYLHVDGLTTQVWLEHAVYEEAGIRTDIRMIMYSGAFIGVVVHAGDVGERIVCNRRSNISREFGQYASPTEKILIRIPSEHRPLGQTGNCLTANGLVRFMQSKKMRKSENQAYRKWLLHELYSRMIQQPFTFPAGHAMETRTTPIQPFTETDFSH